MTRPTSVACVAGTRPLLVAIGPIASAELRCSERHDELRHVDAFTVDGEPRPTRALAFVAHCVMKERSAIVFLFDVADEGWWPIVEWLLETARGRAYLPLLFVRRDRRGTARAEPDRLLALACKLRACVIDAPHVADGLVRTALVPAIGISAAAGPLCFHFDDLARVTRPPAAAYAAICAGSLEELVQGEQGWEAASAALGHPGVSHGFVLIRCRSESTLHDINSLCARIDALAPVTASFMIASTDIHCDNLGEVDILAIHHGTRTWSASSGNSLA